METLIAIAEPALTKCTEDEKEDLAAQITGQKIKASLKEAPKGKSPGPDNIPVEALRALQARLILELTS
ncbi:hypothetical protein DSO57_1017665 [Entomophthora muscae]|uniref:Uncharacterized protein n=1 Tax=Entomophthora muscae TaxID=34485 RepID=A0ACC2SHC0_9FUNG|nr:hypothetical protein DSO57_1017665 [Entomophthora muscae]